MTSDSLRYFVILDALTAEDIEVQKILSDVFNLVRPPSVLWDEPLRSRVYERMAKFDRPESP